MTFVIFALGMVTGAFLALTILFGGMALAVRRAFNERDYNE